MMLDFQQKRKVRSFLYHKVTLIVLGFIVLIVLHSTWVVYMKKRTSEQLKNISLQNVEGLRARSGELKSKIDRLDTTPGIEEEIRSRFSVVKDKENMVVIVPDENAGASTNTLPKSFWAKIGDFLIGK